MEEADFHKQKSVSVWSPNFVSFHSSDWNEVFFFVSFRKILEFSEVFFGPDWDLNRVL